MSVTVVATSRRGAGERYGQPPPPPELSVRARALGLFSRQDVEKEYCAAREGWSVGTEWHCPWCDRDFASPSGARKHMRTRGHVVIRTDYY